MQHDPRTVIYRQPDSFERNVRLVCGSLFGLAIAGVAWLCFSPLSAAVGSSVTIISVAACGACAVRFGDDFWYGALASLRAIF